MTAPDYTELCERLDKRALKVRGYITSSLRVMELLQPEVDKFEKRSGHDLYTVRIAVEHQSSVRTQTKEAEELEQASTAIAELQAQVRTQALEYLALDGQATELQGQVAAKDAALRKIAAFVPAHETGDWAYKIDRKGYNRAGNYAAEIARAALGQGEG